MATAMGAGAATDAASASGERRAAGAGHGADPNVGLYEYEAPWTIHGLHWSQRPDVLRLGFGSFQETYTNKIQVVEFCPERQQLVKIAEQEHHFPLTRLQWAPAKQGAWPDLFVTSGDFLRVWELCSDTAGAAHAAPSASTSGAGDLAGGSGSVRASPYAPSGASPSPSSSSSSSHRIYARATLANSKRDFCAPLTALDWNETDSSLCVTASVDTTCTVWNLRTQQIKTQLIAHDREVYDVAWAKGAEIFASVGADGSVRMFDLRALEHSTIIYETPSEAGRGAGKGAAALGSKGLPLNPDANIRTPTSTPGANGTPVGAATTAHHAAAQAAQAAAAAAAAAAGESQPLVRLVWNKADSNYLATFQARSGIVRVLDVRVPAVPVLELEGHAPGAAICAAAWAPRGYRGTTSGRSGAAGVAPSSSSGGAGTQLVTGATDAHAYVWDVRRMGKDASFRQPSRAYAAPGSVTQLSWTEGVPDWLALTTGRRLQILNL
ncbi:hypothetical protein CXG81DRAFT_24080 [Caulochytrium protostelioides]|uniref:Uncharacterized protein n=1 Tax=Caulochytrium protostelioides TaxID=1555241 RepID=A0A4P9XCX7_9FUNG|nr:hypothetical protein CXG81DRAFT_24080 [Caulochytrium protostelioides]|eukprot:RKP03305.1 hypothetical protein CXG81DRAFT_24080 [Caulochytrium protostelioides]